MLNMSQELVVLREVSAQHNEEGDQDWQPGLFCAAQCLYCTVARWGMISLFTSEYWLEFNILQLKWLSGPADGPHHRAQGAQGVHSEPAQ